MYWTPERVELLCKLWAEGFSARQISQQLGGVSRNAVIGKAYRMKLAHGLPAEDEEQEMFGPDFMQWMCRWPTHEPGRHGLPICGKTVQPGRKLCAEHLTVDILSRKATAA